MKKRLIAILIAGCSSLAFAAESGFVGPSDAPTKVEQGGFIGPSSVNVVSVEEAKNMKDDQHVILRGYIEKHLGGEHNLFKDDSGSIKVDIDKKRWQGLTVTPQDYIEIKGEVDKHLNSVEIDVDSLQKIQK